MRIALLIFSILVLGYLATPQIDPDKPDPEFLASDMHFRLGAETFALPSISLRSISPEGPLKKPLPRPIHDGRMFALGRYKKALKALASDPQAPLSVRHLRLRFHVYRTHGEHTASSAVCVLFTQNWPKEICGFDRKAPYDDLPRTVDLYSEESLTSGKNSASYKVKYSPYIERLDRLSAVPEIICLAEETWCTALMWVEPDVLAIWSSGARTGSMEDDEAQGRNQAVAILAVLSESKLSEKTQ